MTTHVGPNERGFTMIEVMIALLLTAIAVMGVIALFLSETKQSSFSRHNAEAAVLANDRLEKMRTQVVTVGTTPESSLDPQGNSGGMFERKTVVSQGADTSYYTIEVRVGWDEDEAAATACASDSTCSSNFCLSSSVCADRAVVVRGKRIAN